MSDDPPRPIRQFGTQLSKSGGICGSPRSYDEVNGGERSEQLTPQDLAYPAPQTIAGHRGLSESGNDDPGPRVALRIRTPSYFEVTHAHPAPGFPALQQISPAR
jgi:hypothetical protein